MRTLLTGASGGIGQAVAEELARRGARLVLAARGADRLNEVANTVTAAGREAVVVRADVTDADDRARLIDTAVARLGGLDLLVNVSGIGSFGHFKGSNEQILREVMEVNFFAPVELIRLAVPHLTKGDRPAVVNLTSMCGRRAMPSWSEYSASKFALMGMSEAMRGEFARFGIDVICIVPGLTRTDFSKHMLRDAGKMRIPYEKGMSPEYVARRVARAIETNSREVVLGWEARLMVAWNRFAPRLLNRLIARKVKRLHADELTPTADKV